MKIIENKRIYIFFLTILVISILTPISGDDYGNYISTNGSLHEAFDIAKSYYYSLEGRFIGRIIIMFTTYHKYLWNIITPILFTLLFKSMTNIIKQKTSISLLIISLLLMNTDMFSQSYTWLAGSITYLYPTCLIIFYFSQIYIKNNEFTLYDNIILIILSLIIPMFVENLACAYVFGLLLINIYFYIKNKKIKPIYLTNLIVSSIVLIIMLKSPGSLSRALVENVEFNNYNIIKKIITNISNFNLYIFFKNPLMIILTIIPINYYLIKKHHIIFTPIFNIIPILSIIKSIYYMLPMKFTFLQNIITFLDTSNKLYIIYWIIYTILLVLSIQNIISDKKLKHYLYFLLLVSFSSTLSMLVVPTWGDRITLFNVITLSFIGVVLIDNIYKYNEKTSKLINSLSYMTCVYILIIFISIFQINNYRNNYIQEQLKTDEQTIKVIRNPITYIWNTNPSSEYFIKTYKSYMNIPKNKDIEIYKIPYKNYISIILGVI